jgi:hypothetical protein
MNYQIEKSLRLFCYTKEIFLLGLFLVIVTAPFRRTFPRFLIYAFLVTLALGWFWGIRDPFYWDGIHIAGRSLLFIHGRWDLLPRFSLNYVFLGATLRFMGNYNWTGHLYIMLCGGGILYLLSRTRRVPISRVLIVMMAFIAPHLFILNKWLYTDIPTIAVIVATVLSYDHAAGRPSLKRFLLSFLLLVFASLMKEVGAVALIPALFLPFFMSPKMRLRSILLIILSVVVSLSVFMILFKYYRTHQRTINSSHLKWILLSKNAAPSRLITLHWFFWAVREHLRTAFWWGFLLFAIMSLIRPGKSWGYLILFLTLICQIVLMVAARGFEDWGIWHSCPLSESRGNDLAHCMIALMMLLLVIGLATGQLRCRSPKRLEWFSWIMVLAIVLIFSALGKIQPMNKGQYHWIDLDWRYLANAIPFAILLAGRGAASLLSRKGPVWFRIMASLALALSFYVIMLRSAAVAVFYGEKARLNGRFYETARKQPERTIFTHWPFVMEAPIQYDYGSLRWESDRFDVKSLVQLNQLHSLPPAKQERLRALVLQTEGFYPGFSSWKRFPDSLRDETATIMISRPFDFHPYTRNICRNYLARVVLPQKKRPPQIDPTLFGAPKAK